MHVKNSAMMNGLYAKAEAYRANLKYRGKGEISFYVLRYPAKKGIKLKGGNRIVKKLTLDSKDWTYAKFDFAKVGDPKVERQVIGLWVKGSIDFDEVYVSPLQK